MSPGGSVRLEVIVGGLHLAIELLGKPCSVRSYPALHSLALGFTCFRKPPVLQPEEDSQQNKNPGNQNYRNPRTLHNVISIMQLTNGRKQRTFGTFYILNKFFAWS